MFSQPDIKLLFEHYLFVALYTDRVPNEFYAPEIQGKLQGLSRQIADAEANLEFLKKEFGTIQLPLYVILEPQLNGKVHVVAVYDEGLINNVSHFAEFLRNPDGKAMGSLAQNK